VEELDGVEEPDTEAVGKVVKVIVAVEVMVCDRVRVEVAVGDCECMRLNVAVAEPVFVAVPVGDAVRCKVAEIVWVVVIVAVGVLVEDLRSVIVGLGV
jgi:hypothetical protein